MPASALGTGFAMGLGLIAAIGAQNAFVLRQGIRREFIVPVVAICIVSDATLIMAGYFGLGAFLSQQPKLITAMKWLGAAYLVYIGLQSLRNLRNSASLEVSTPDQANGHADATTLHNVAVTALSHLGESARLPGHRYFAGQRCAPARGSRFFSSASVPCWAPSCGSQVSGSVPTSSLPYSPLPEPGGSSRFWWPLLCSSWLGCWSRRLSRGGKQQVGAGGQA